MSSVTAHRGPSLLVPLLTLLGSAVLTMFLLSQLLLPEVGDRRLLELAREANTLFCGLADNNALCPRAQGGAPRADARPQAKPPIKHNNDAQPFGELQWRGGSEAEAAAFIATIKTLGMRDFENHSRYLDKETTAIITPVFRDYPTLVSASACIFCGSISEAILKNIEQQELTREWALEVGRGIDRYLPLLAERQVLDAEELQRLARIQAQLGHAGSSQIGEFVARQLIVQGDRALLQLWVSKGLNGGHSLRDEAQLSVLPREVVIAAWRQGTAGGSDPRLLTEYLLKSGYRPALRWLVWLQDGGAANLSNNYTAYKYYRQQYEGMLRNHTDFPVYAGKGLGEFYSRNWQAIRWDDSTKKWVH